MTRLSLIGNAVLIVAILGLLWRLDYVDAERDEAVRVLELQVATYRMAAEQAKAEQTAAARSIEQKQNEVTHNASTDYQQRIVAVRLRAQAAADSRPASSGDLSGVPDSACGLDAAAPQAGLPSDALIATEQAIQLDELQAWVRAQAAIDREPAR